MGELLQSPAVVFYLGVGAGLALGSVLGAGGNDDALDEAALAVLLVLFWPALVVLMFLPPRA